MQIPPHEEILADYPSSTWPKTGTLNYLHTGTPLQHTHPLDVDSSIDTCLYESDHIVRFAENAEASFYTDAPVILQIRHAVPHHHHHHHLTRENNIQLDQDFSSFSVGKTNIPPSSHSSSSFAQKYQLQLLMAFRDDPLEVFEFSCSSAKFAQLRKRQSLLVSYESFHHSLAALFNKCLESAHSTDTASFDDSQYKNSPQTQAQPQPHPQSHSHSNSQPSETHNINSLTNPASSFYRIFVLSQINVDNKDLPFHAEAEHHPKPNRAAGPDSPLPASKPFQARSKNIRSSSCDSIHSSFQPKRSASTPPKGREARVHQPQPQLWNLCVIESNPFRLIYHIVLPLHTASIPTKKLYLQSFISKKNKLIHDLKLSATSDQEKIGALNKDIHQLRQIVAQNAAAQTQLNYSKAHQNDQYITEIRDQVLKELNEQKVIIENLKSAQREQHQYKAKLQLLTTDLQHAIARADNLKLENQTLRNKLTYLAKEVVELRESPGPQTRANTKATSEVKLSHLEENNKRMSALLKQYEEENKKLKIKLSHANEKAEYARNQAQNSERLVSWLNHQLNLTSDQQKPD